MLLSLLSDSAEILLFCSCEILLNVLELVTSQVLWLVFIVSYSIYSNNSRCESKPEASSSFTIKNSPVKEISAVFVCLACFASIIRIIL